MMAARLEVRVHMVTVASSALQNVVTAVNRAGCMWTTRCSSLWPAPMLSYEPTAGIGRMPRRLGAGSPASSFPGRCSRSHRSDSGRRRSLYQRSFGGPLHSGRRGGEIKRLYGNAIVTLIPEGTKSKFLGRDRPSRLISQRMVGEILEPRAANCSKCCVTTCGTQECSSSAWRHCADRGGCRLPGILEIAESVLHRPLRLAWPAPLAKMPSTLAEPDLPRFWAWCSTDTAPASPWNSERRWSSKLKAMFVGKERRHFVAPAFRPRCWGLRRCGGTPTAAGDGGAAS